jgi:uncharacterized protein with PIN domain
MDGTASALREKLEQLLREAAEVSVAMDRADGTIVGVPHYSVIEARAHQLGQQLSREIQARQMGVIVSTQMTIAKCPGCGTRCETVPKKRSVKSIDGSVSMEEPVAICPKCRRGFFPPPGGARV